MLVALGNLAVEYIEAKTKLDKERREAGETVNNHPKVDAFIAKYHLFKPRRCKRHQPAPSRWFYAGSVHPYAPWFKGMKKSKYIKLVHALGRYI